MRKSFLFETNKQKEKKEKRKQKYSIVNIIPMSIPANNNPNRTNHHRYSVNQSRPGPGQTRTKEPSRSSRLGLLYVHCARAFTPLNTQRHGARFHGVGMYKPVQGGQRQRTWCPHRERERGGERGRREVVDHPQNGLPTFTHFVYDEPRLWQRFRGSFVPPGTALGWNVFFLSFPGILLRATASNYKAWSRGRLTWLGRAGFSINGGCEEDYGWECCLRATDVGCVEGGVCLYVW